MTFDLSALAALPGVIQTAVADDAGRLLGFDGDSEPPTAAILVLAHATLSAASELGRRSGSGDCHEIIQQHEGGCIYLHGLPQRRVLLVRCLNASAVPTVRTLCQNLAAPAETQHSSSPFITDMASALHAEPAW
jgi:hypothetical protein